MTTNMEAKVDSHGTHQFELTFVYPVPREVKRVRYRCEMYLFTPSQLAVTKERYGVKRFLEDVRSYTRYTIPSLTLADLADAGCALSPLTRLRAFLAEKPESKTSAMVYELRMIACIFRSRVKQRRKELERLLSRVEGAADERAVVEAVEAFHEAGKRVLDAFRKDVLAHPALSRCDEAVRRSAAWADEALSLAARKQWLVLLAAAQRREGLHGVVAVLGPAVEREDEYRARLAGAAAEGAKEEDGQQMVYRESVLKKWAEGCLYMSAPKNRATDRVAQALFGVAAGAAMLFAVIATMQVNRWFKPESLQWAVLIVLMYMLKDRIKEWLRSFVTAFVPQVLADRTEDLVDFAGSADEPKTFQVGSSRLRVRFCKANRVDSDVKQARMRCSELEPTGPEENVIEFQKELKLDAARLRARHKRLDSITEILRVEVDALLSKMDDAWATARRYRGGRLEEFLVPRIYRSHLLLRFGHFDGPLHVVQYRLELTREGILRIENVP